MDDSKNIIEETITPQSITQHMPENKTIFTISSLVSIVTCLISIFALDHIDLSYRIIFCLSVISFILFFNVVFLYVKEREHYYQTCYNIAMSQALIKKVKEIEEENEKLKSNINFI